MMAVLQAAELAVGGQAVRLLRAKRFHFRAPVRPGDDFVIELTTVEQNDAEWTVRASGSVNGEERVKGTLVLSTAPTVRRVSSRNESKGYWSSARLLLGARETGG
jgi:3-hydroxymyristoyl/3-hydroxydecanoyl-(acyl carrier protein) dehydratase